MPPELVTRAVGGLAVGVSALLAGAATTAISSFLIFLLGVFLGIALVIIPELHARRGEHHIWIQVGRPERRREQGEHDG